jgi:hypothetical protein
MPLRVKEGGSDVCVELTPIIQRPAALIGRSGNYKMTFWARSTTSFASAVRISSTMSRHRHEKRGAALASSTERREETSMPLASDGDEVEIRRDGDAVVLEPIKKRRWPDNYWSWVDKHRDELELGEVEPLGGALVDLASHDDE